MSHPAKLQLARTALLVLLVFASFSLWAADGRVLFVSGQPTLNGLPLNKASQIGVGDVLKTPAGSSVKVLLSDGSVLDIKPETTLRITQHVYRARQPSTWRQRIDLVKGAMRYVSGAIVKRSPDKASIRAGRITIGVRGSFQSISFDGINVQVDSAIGEAILTFADGSTLSIQRGNSGFVNVTSGDTSITTITETDPVMQAATTIADAAADPDAVQNALKDQSGGDQALVLAVLINNAAELGVTDPDVLADAVGGAAGASKENAALFVLVASALDPVNKETYKARAKAAAPDQANDIDEAADLGADLAPDDEAEGEDADTDDDQDDDEQDADEVTGEDTAENPATLSPTTP